MTAVKEECNKNGRGKKKRTAVRYCESSILSVVPPSPRTAILRMSQDNYRKSNCEVDADIAAESRREDSPVCRKPFGNGARVANVAKIVDKEDAAGRTPCSANESCNECVYATRIVSASAIGVGRCF